MAVSITNTLTLYDIYVMEALKTKFTSVDVENKWVYIPADLALSYASEKFGQALFPMYTVFRAGPPIKNLHASLASFRNDYNLSGNTSMQQLLVDVVYNIDFWSRDMLDMNESVLDYFDFAKDNYLPFDFTKVGLTELTENMECPIKLEDPVDNSAIDDIYNIGRYFRYTYSFKMTALIFDIVDEIELKELVLGLYQNDITEINKLFETTITPVEE
jgi:hypothetical protein